MESSFIEFPTHDDWKQIYKKSHFNPVFTLINKVENKYHKEVDKSDFFDWTEISSYIYELRKRLAGIARGYILMMYYFKKGIPDQQWYISPGKNGQSIEYFPDFQERHFYLKGWFDFYSDIFYFKIFSAWDTLGHLLDAKYNLNIKKVNFLKVIEALKSEDQFLHEQLSDLTKTDSYKKGRKIRNDLTHNYAPNIAGMAVFKPKPSPIGLTHVLGLKDYTTSEEISANARELIDLFSDTLRAVLKHKRAT